MIKKITLVESALGLVESGVFTRHSSLEPLGLEYLAAVLNNNGFNTKILQQKGETAKGFLDKILITNPDLVAFSTFTYTFPYSLNLAGMIKGTNLKIRTVFGGVHVSSIPQDVDNKAIDFGVFGEGEYALLELIKGINNGRQVKNIEGIIYWKDGIKITKPRPRIENLDELPFPLRPREILERTRINTLMYPSKSEQKGVASIAYSRGCPYGCSYCASKNIWGKQVKWRSAKSVVDEIEELEKQFGTNTIFFTDLTFNLDKGKVLELCNEIKNRGSSVHWDAMLRATTPDGSLLVDPELLKEMKKAGCSKVSYGLESLIPDIQRQYKKKGEIEAISQVLECGDRIGLFNKAYLMLGEPKLESRESLEMTRTVLRQLPLDEIRVSFLTPFPNTSTYTDCTQEGRILTRDWARYTSDEPILRLDRINKEELEATRNQIFQDFYNNLNYEKRLKSKISRFPYLKKSYDEYFDFLKDRRMIK